MMSVHHKAQASLKGCLLAKYDFSTEQLSNELLVSEKLELHESILTTDK